MSSKSHSWPDCKAIGAVAPTVNLDDERTAGIGRALGRRGLRKAAGLRSRALLEIGRLGGNRDGSDGDERAADKHQVSCLRFLVIEWWRP
jgi:hypothetical protein